MCAQKQGHHGFTKDRRVVADVVWSYTLIQLTQQLIEPSKFQRS